MRGGDADEFIDFMNEGEASVRCKSYVYRFSGLRYNSGRGMYRISIEKYRFTKEPFEEFMELVYHYESDDAEDVLNHLCEDLLWDGKSFYDLEKALTWIDW